MKTIKQFLLAIFLIALAGKALSSENIKVKGDTIRIKFENYLLEVATFDLKKHTLANADIQKKVNELLSQLDKVELIEPGDGEKICIRYSGYIGGVEHEFKKLELKSATIKKKSVVVSGDKLLETDFGNILMEMEDENYLIRMHLENLNDAKTIDSGEFTEKILAADKEIPENRKKTNGWLLENNGSYNSYFIGEVPPLTLDMLELNAGVGAGWIYNQFVSSFNFRIGLAFAKKGIMKNKYFADYELLYDFSNSNDNNFDINGFLSLGWEKNFSLDPNKAKWYGISAGYLVGRGNEFFKKNTFKVAVHKQISNSISIKPEIYFNDFFKNGSPGLRIQIAF